MLIDTVRIKFGVNCRFRLCFVYLVDEHKCWCLNYR